MISTEPGTPRSLSFAAACLVLGESRSKASRRAMRSSRASCEKMARRPARYIFLLTLWLKFSSGEFGKVRPPPRQIGEDVMPERARPVPFWRHGFLVECLTVPRSFWARLIGRAHV